MQSEPNPSPARIRKLAVQTPRRDRHSLFLKICPSAWLKGGKAAPAYPGK